MKKLLLVLLVIVLAASVFSCTSRKASSVVVSFFDSVRQSDETQAIALFPAIEKLEQKERADIFTLFNTSENPFIVSEVVKGTLCDIEVETSFNDKKNYWIFNLSLQNKKWLITDFRLKKTTIDKFTLDE